MDVPCEVISICISQENIPNNFKWTGVNIKNAIENCSCLEKILDIISFINVQNFIVFKSISSQRSCYIRCIDCNTIFSWMYVFS